MAVAESQFLEMLDEMLKNLVQPWLNLIERNKALAGKKNRALAKNQLAAMGFGANGNAHRTLKIIGMHLVVGTVDLAGRLEQGGIKYR